MLLECWLCWNVGYVVGMLVMLLECWLSCWNVGYVGMLVMLSKRFLTDKCVCRRGFREEDEKLDPLETGGAHGGLGNLMGGGPIEDRAMGVCDGIKPATSFLGIDQ